MARPRILAIDVGTGTQDILILEAGGIIENAVQLIMPSPTALLAERVKQATRDRVDLVLTGVTMGGGPDHWAVEAHLMAGLNVFATQMRPGPSMTTWNASRRWGSGSSTQQPLRTGRAASNCATSTWPS